VNDEDYKAALESARWRYSTHGLNASTRAYEYGLLVVKNAFLVAGGGLFFIPAMVGLSAELQLSYAFYAGMWFAAAVLLALLANYIIHLNWLFIEAAWEHVYEIEKIDVRSAYGRAFRNDVAERARLHDENVKTGKRIAKTFWAPHIIAALFLICIVVAAVNLYWAFNIFPALEK